MMTARFNSGFRSAAAGAAGAVIATLLVAAVVAHTQESSLAPAVPVTQAPVLRVVPDAGQLQLSYAPVVKRAAPAVVNIFAAKLVQSGPRTMQEYLAQQFSGVAPPPRVAQSLGSGVIVGADGLIVTNSHVVGGATEILVALADRREFPAKILFSDARTDLAVLRIDTKGARLPTVDLADSDQIEVGDVVLAIGDPFGIGQTVTHGIVSALARNGLGASDRQFFIQTDAAINPGNSGGALLDMQGRLIGINSMIYSQTGNSVGIGFAIPSNMVKVFLTAAPSGKLVTGWIGAEGEGLTSATAKALGYDRGGGVLITAVSPDSPAAIAGIKPGDILTQINGNDVNDAGQLRYRIATEPVGQSVSLKLLRDRQPLALSIKLAAPPENPPRQLTPIAGNNILSGITIANLSPALAQELGNGAPESGVVVAKIAAGAPAARLINLRPGDVIESVNGQPVTTVKDTLTALVTGTPALAVRRGAERYHCNMQNGGFACGR